MVVQDTCGFCRYSSHISEFFCILDQLHVHMMKIYCSAFFTQFNLPRRMMKNEIDPIGILIIFKAKHIKLKEIQKVHFSVQEGRKIEVLENIHIPEGTSVLDA